MAEHDDDAPKTTEPPPEAKGSKGSSPNKESILGIVGFLLALSVGFYTCQAVQRHRAESQQAEWQGFEDRGRYSVQLSGHEPQKGPSDALVTIIEFSDYECPYCQRADEPLMEALGDNDDVRLIFKHFPLPMHPNAIPAARAAWAAQQQGKFWEMHEHLFSVGGKLDDIEQVAGRMGLDVDRFRQDMVSEAAGEAIEADRYAAGRLGIGSTPHFVINGRHVRGALAPKHWEKIIESEREEAEALISKGTPRSQVYETFMKDAPTQRAKPSNGPDPSKRHPVTAGEGRPSLGPDDAPITIVEFSDFQCPFCAKLAPTMHELATRHPDVRVVFRQFPLPMHSAARPAAKAALAAHRQGKFWEMHDALFEKGGKIDADDLEGLAAQIGLDMSQFGRDIEDPAIEQMIAEDEAMARKVGVTGTPASFVNGRFIGGAQSTAAFDALIEQERTAASGPAEAEPPAGAGGG